MKRMLAVIALTGILAGCSTGQPVKADILPLIKTKAGEYNYIAKASDQKIQAFIDGLYEAGTLEHGKGNDARIYSVYLNSANETCNAISQLAQISYADLEPKQAALEVVNDITRSVTQSEDKEYKRQFEQLPKLALVHICPEITLGVYLP